jgi:hypothetical protein
MSEQSRSDPHRTECSIDDARRQQSRDPILCENTPPPGFETAIAQDLARHNPSGCCKKTSGSHREKRSKQTPAPMVNRALTSPSLW